MILYIYSMDSIVQTTLNEASISRDENKVETLGPFAVLFGEIIYFANHNRIVFNGLDLYRATCLPDSKISQYR
jgi:hypothetical protein